MDGTAPSHLALQEAIGLSRLTQARLRLLYVIEDIPQWDFHHPLHLRRAMRATENHGNAVLNAAQSTVRQHGLVSDTVMRPANGRPVYELIVNEAVSTQADLLVMGSGGGFSLGPFLFGSVAQKVVYRCPVPVLILRL